LKEGFIVKSGKSLKAFHPRKKTYEPRNAGAEEGLVFRSF